MNCKNAIFSEFSLHTDNINIRIPENIFYCNHPKLFKKNFNHIKSQSSVGANFRKTSQIV